MTRIKSKGSHEHEEPTRKKSRHKADNLPRSLCVEREGRRSRKSNKDAPWCHAIAFEHKENVGRVKPHHVYGLTSVWNLYNLKNGDNPAPYKVLMLDKNTFKTILWTCYEKIPTRDMKLTKQVETNFSMQYTN